MPLDYDFSEHTIFNHDPSLTEQEHKDSCDINKMIRGALKGQQINMSQNQPQYGNDDMTLDAVTYRIQKATLENNLENLSKTHEFSEEELKYIPDSIRQKYKFKLKKQNDKLNDDTNTSSNNSPNLSTPTNPPLKPS